MIPFSIFSGYLFYLNVLGIEVFDVFAVVADGFGFPVAEGTSGTLSGAGAFVGVGIVVAAAGSCSHGGVIFLGAVATDFALSWGAAAFFVASFASPTFTT